MRLRFEIGILLFVLGVGWCRLAAQSTVLTVVDEATGQSLAGAEFRWQSRDGKAGGAISNSMGKAHIRIADSADLEVRLIGYAPLTRRIAPGGHPTIFLSPDPLSLEPVVVTAQMEAGTISESVYPVKVIDRRRIEAQGAVNLRDVLRQELNVQLQQDQILGTGLSLQGLSGQQVKIMVDGVPVVGRENGNIDLSQLNLNQVERIEVIEGPLSVPFGTDALGGTINIITRKTATDHFNATARSYVESVGQFNADGAVEAAGSWGAIALSGGRNFFGGYSENESGRFRDWKPKEQYFGGLNYSRNLRQWRLKVGSDYFQELITNRGALRAPYYETAFDDEYFTQRLDQHLHLKGPLSGRWSGDIVAGINHYLREKRSYLKDLTTLESQLLADEEQDTSRFGLYMSRGNFTRTSPGAWSLQLGYDAQHQTAFGSRIDDRSQAMTDLAAFGMLRYQPRDWLKLQTGVRGSYNSNYSAPLTPSFNLWARSNSNWIFRLAYARGFRAPTLKELHLFFVDINHNIQGNPNLRAEYSHHGSAAVERTWVSEANLLRVQGRTWYNDLNDQISLALANGSTNLYTYQNVLRSRSGGTTLTADWKREGWGVQLGGSVIGQSREFIEAGDAPWVFSGEGTARLNYEWEWPGIQWALFYKYSGRTPQVTVDSEGNFSQFTLGDFHTLDLSASRSFLKNRFHCTLGGKNLLNVTSIANPGPGGVHSGSSTTLPMNWGRTVFVNLKWNLK